MHDAMCSRILVLQCMAQQLDFPAGEQDLSFSHHRLNVDCSRSKATTVVDSHEGVIAGVAE